MGIGIQSAASAIHSSIALECFQNYYIQEIQRHSSTPVNIFFIAKWGCFSSLLPFFLLFPLLPPIHFRYFVLLAASMCQRLSYALKFRIEKGVFSLSHLIIQGKARYQQDGECYFNSVLQGQKRKLSQVGQEVTNRVTFEFDLQNASRCFDLFLLFVLFSSNRI